MEPLQLITSEQNYILVLLVKAQTYNNNDWISLVLAGENGLNNSTFMFHIIYSFYVLLISINHLFVSNNI